MFLAPPFMSSEVVGVEDDPSIAANRCFFNRNHSQCVKLGHLCKINNVGKRASSSAGSVPRPPLTSAAGSDSGGKLVLTSRLFVRSLLSFLTSAIFLPFTFSFFFFTIGHLVNQILLPRQCSTCSAVGHDTTRHVPPRTNEGPSCTPLDDTAGRSSLLSGRRCFERDGTCLG